MTSQIVAALLLAAGSLLPGLWLSLQPAAACSCATVSPSEHLEWAELAVVGVPASAPNTTPAYATLAVNVEEYLVGAGPEQITVDNNTGSCALFLPEAARDRYLLYIDRGDDGVLHTTLCSGFPLAGETGAYGQDRLNDLRAYLALQDDGTQTPTPVPTPGTALPPAGTGSNHGRGDTIALLSSVAIAAVILAGAGFSAWRSKR
jgi:hypothetical protein